MRLSYGAVVGVVVLREHRACAVEHRQDGIIQAVQVCRDRIRGALPRRERVAHVLPGRVHRAGDALTIRPDRPRRGAVAVADRARLQPPQTLRHRRDQPKLQRHHEHSPPSHRPAHPNPWGKQNPFRVARRSAGRAARRAREPYIMLPARARGRHAVGARGRRGRRLIACLQDASAPRRARALTAREARALPSLPRLPA
jgi:hypothetical protein